jgi:hypothetical protein
MDSDKFCCDNIYDIPYIMIQRIYEKKFNT